MNTLVANCFVFLLLYCTQLTTNAADPLPSWNDGQVKTSIVDFVNRVTTAGDPDFVPVEERVATFDNDGCLWSEKPYYFQLAFAIDRVRELAPQHPEWKTEQPFKAVLENDLETVAKSGMEGLLKLVMVSHAGMTTEEFHTIAKDWLDNARHPRFDRRYNELVFQPMLELLTYLRANGFKTYITSGGGRSRHSEIPMAICRCCNGQQRATVHDSACWFITRTPTVNGRTIGIHMLVGWTKRSMKRNAAIGRSWT